MARLRRIAVVSALAVAGFGSATSVATAEEPSPLPGVNGDSSNGLDPGVPTGSLTVNVRYAGTEFPAAGYPIWATNPYQLNTLRGDTDGNGSIHFPSVARGQTIVHVARPDTGEVFDIIVTGEVQISEGQASTILLEVPAPFSVDSYSPTCGGPRTIVSITWTGPGGVGVFFGESTQQGGFVGPLPPLEGMLAFRLMNQGRQTMEFEIPEPLPGWTGPYFLSVALGGFRIDLPYSFECTIDVVLPPPFVTPIIPTPDAPTETTPGEDPDGGIPAVPENGDQTSPPSAPDTDAEEAVQAPSPSTDSDDTSADQEASLSPGGPGSVDAIAGDTTATQPGTLPQAGGSVLVPTVLALLMLLAGFGAQMLGRRRMT